MTKHILLTGADWALLILAWNLAGYGLFGVWIQLMEIAKR